MLAEDKRHQNLIRRFLDRAGFGYHLVRFADLPSGRGCGEQWVRDRYVREVGALRLRSSRASTALIVAIDADTLDVADRATQLRLALSSAKLDARASGEQIAHLIPKRNVETWLLCLTGQAVDEMTDYRNQPGIEAANKPAAEALFNWSRDNAAIPPHCVPSLRVAISEVRRVEVNKNA